MNGKKEMKPYTILIVDDEPDIVETIEFNLTLAGMICITASEGVEAIQKIQQEKPDLILLDVMMPKMNGYDLCRKLKTDDHFKSIPVLMLTAKVQDPDHRIGMEAGADAYITKPFDMDELLAQIKRYLSGVRGTA